MSNKHLVVIIVALLVLLGLGTAAFLRSGDSRKTAARGGDDLPFMRLDQLLTKKKAAYDPGTEGVPPGAKAVPQAGGRIADLSRRTGESGLLSKVNIPVSKRKKGVGQWADTDAYRGLFSAPEPFVTPSYAEVMAKKADEIARLTGFNRAFGAVMDQALSSRAFAEAERLFDAGKLDEALRAFQDLQKSTDNLYLRSMAASFIMKIYDSQGKTALFEAARANVAILSAQVAKEAFPEAVRRMGEESPAVKKAMAALSGGEIMRLGTATEGGNPQ